MGLYFRKMLRYNKKLKPLARELRKNMTDAEMLLWSKVRRKQLLGYQFYRQITIGRYIVDFYCPKTKLVKNSSNGLKPKVIPTIAVTAEAASLSPNSTPASRTTFSVISKTNPVSENKEAPTFSPNSPVSSVPKLNLSVNKGTSAWTP